MNLIALINPENVSEEEVKTYNTRQAARAIVRDQQGDIALLSVKKESYYKLPGGGIELGEEISTALERECLEEIGCNITIQNEIGYIVEYRKIFKLKQTSFCFLAEVKGEKGQPSFTQSELEDGFEIIWLPIQQALSKLETCKANSIEGIDYIVPRDVAFIKSANSLFFQKN